MSLTVVRPTLASITQPWGQLEGQPWGTKNPFGVNGHPGTDYGAAQGSEIKACADGVVIWAGYADGFGFHTVAIWHPELGVTSTYGHMEAHYVNLGQSVSAGMVIGLADNQGYSFGSHLHFEIRPLNAPFGGNPPNIDSEAWLVLHLQPPVIPGLTDADRKQIKRMQYLLGMPANLQTGYWGQTTDNTWQSLRFVSLSPPRPAKPAKGVAAVQHDLLHFSQKDCDGIWGPITDQWWQLLRMMWRNK